MPDYWERETSKPRRPLAPPPGPYWRNEAEERQREDDEAQEWAEQHAEDKPDPEYRA